MTKKSTPESTPENGPRFTTEHAKVVETEILVQRGPKHPHGPGVSRIVSYSPRKD